MPIQFTRHEQRLHHLLHRPGNVHTLALDQIGQRRGRNRRCDDEAQAQRRTDRFSERVQ